MKRIALIVLAISLLLLSGCSHSEEKEFAEFAAQLAKADTVSFNGHVTAEYSALSAQFDLAFTEHDGESEIEVLKPDIVSGVKARVKDGETSLEYEGLMLDIGNVGDTWLSPMSSLPVFFRAMKDAHLDLAWDEDDMLVVRLVPEDDITVTVWIDSDSNTPKNAEITYNEKTAIFIDISDWEVK